ncbi:hypothetical protein DFH07DRAFT_973890 [Mycena maculata]|uniref:Uncharacterized protein n=1 Tax=Mycena maculata TaxID=230809 RepID=A0AAD7HBQ1_9AGAR|nr:hypothetical protein DFH07DRAFT_973890 [Mycena maculata]
MSFRFGNGNHIVPAGAESTSTPMPPLTPTPHAPTPTSTSPASAPPDDIHALARLLHAKITALERALAERRARRTEWRAGVARLDKMLIALRVQDAREGAALTKLSRRWHDRNRHLYSDGVPHLYGRDHITGAERAAFVCPTTQAASAFNGHSERYSDSYTFAGPVLAAAPFSSHPRRSPVVYDYGSVHSDGVSPDKLDLSRGQDLDLDIATPTPTPKQEYHGLHGRLRAALADIRNTQQDVVLGEAGREGRKRKSVDFDFAGEGDDAGGAYKKARAGEGEKRRSYRGTRSRRNSGMSY